MNGILAAGGIIIGKAGLSEWANYRGRSVSGWSGRGGQVAVSTLYEKYSSPYTCFLRSTAVFNMFYGFFKSTAARALLLSYFRSTADFSYCDSTDCDSTFFV